MTPEFMKAQRGILTVAMAAVGIFFSQTSVAVTPARRPVVKRVTPSAMPISYIKDLSVFHSGLSLQISAVERFIAIPDGDVEKRLMEFKKDTRIEPIQLTASADDEKILELAGRIAKPGRKLALANYLRENFQNGEEVPGTNLKLVNLDMKSFDWVNRDGFDNLFAKEHYDLKVKTEDLHRSPALQENLLTQLAPYLSPQQLQLVKTKITLGKNLEVDRDLLPTFARQMVRQHTVFKGPNCFHAALSFQSPLLPKSSLINVREEPGYHRSMINYDEMWRAAQLDFYEIDPSKTDIKYGDMILFFDAPKTAQTSVDFKTLRHAATYLFGGYVFAKASKSANSPYLVKPLADEWSTWEKYTENLGVKVFRRNLKRVNKAAVWDPSDWMY